LAEPGRRGVWRRRADIKGRLGRSISPRAIPRFYRGGLLNPHWDGKFQVRHESTLAVSMISQGLDPLPAGAAWHPFLEWPASGWDKLVAGRVWRPFLDWIAASPQDCQLAAPPTIASMPARDFWNADFFRAHAQARSLLTTVSGRCGRIIGGSATARILAPSGWVSIDLAVRIVA
jgi:hypothetical protein